MKLNFSYLLLALAIFCALPASAQKFQPKNILFVGADDYSESELLAASNLKPGIILTNSEMSDHTKLLLDSGVFDSVSYKFDGLNLTFNLTPAQFMYPVRFSNLPFAQTPDLEAELHSKFPLYHGELPPEGGLVDGIRAVLEEKLLVLGIHATISALPYSAANEHKITALDFTIVTPPVLIGEISLEGPSQPFLSKVQELVHRSRMTTYDQHTSAQNIQHSIENYYADQGYAVAKVKVTSAPLPLITAGNIQMLFSVNIEEGRPYKLGIIHLAADIPVTQDELFKAANLRSGDVVKGASIRAAWNFITNKFKSNGYMMCTLDTKTKADDSTGIVDYYVTAVTGSQFRMGSIRFEGFNEQVHDELMKSWKLKAGDIFDTTYVESFVMKYASKNDASRAALKGGRISFIENSDTASHVVNVIYKFEH